MKYAAFSTETQSFMNCMSPAGSQAAEAMRHPQKDRMVLLMISTASRISSSLITSRGANLMMSPWVGLARSPLSRSRRHTFQASQSLVSLITIAFSNPFHSYSHFNIRRQLHEFISQDDTHFLCIFSKVFFFQNLQRPR